MTDPVTPKRDIDSATITPAVVRSMAGCPDARLRTVMTCLIEHLHAFARETRLTEAEWDSGIEFLTATGQISDERRQEFILLSDVLGLSTLITALNHPKPPGCTEATVLGPFFVANAPHFHQSADLAAGAPGAPCFVSGTVRGLDGAPVANAELDVWQADSEGLYDVQRMSSEGHVPAARGRLVTDRDGRFAFRSIVAEPYPIPHDGPVGRLLSTLRRHPWRPAHLHFIIQADGYETLVTHVFRAGDRYLDSDAVFGVRSSLVADWQAHEPGTAPDGSSHAATFYTLAFDFVLAPLSIQA